MRSSSSANVPAASRLGAAVSAAPSPDQRSKLAATKRREPALQSVPARTASSAEDAFDLPHPNVRPPALRYFIPPEHAELGDAASSNEVASELELGDGTKLSFGDLVALSGDYFASPDEMRQLATTDEGRAELRWARWSAISRQGPEPDVAPEVKQRVRTRYFALTADNSGHFSQGGTAIANYERGHAEAMRKAWNAGATGNEALFAAAVTDEACCQHYLSDMFSAGHVRTPIIEIREYYRRVMPDSIKKIFGYAAERVADTLRRFGDVPWYWPPGIFESRVLDTIEQTAGKVVESFSLGDIIVLACHNSDGNGLDVVSDVDASGKAIAGGFHWRAVGDSLLVPDSITWNMAVAAMRVSRAELDQARSLGARGVRELPPPAATHFIPLPDQARESPIAWRWGTMDDRMVAAIDSCLRGQLIEELRRNAPEPSIQRYNRKGRLDPKGSIVLHVGDAYEAFCRELEAAGIRVLERAVGAPAQAKAVVVP